MPECACGCGESARAGRRYLHGHNRRTPNKTERDPVLGCLLWKAAKTSDGYALVRHEGRTRLARRVYWEAEHGPIPPGHVLRSKCKRAACVEPHHLELSGA